MQISFRLPGIARRGALAALEMPVGNVDTLHPGRQSVARRATSASAGAVSAAVKMAQATRVGALKSSAATRSRVSCLVSSSLTLLVGSSKPDTSRSAGMPQAAKLA